jgi:hypothetical protein
LKRPFASFWHVADTLLMPCLTIRKDHCSVYAEIQGWGRLDSFLRPLKEVGCQDTEH